MESRKDNGSVTETDVVVVGGGISGLVAGKCMRDDGFKVIIIERTGEIGGLWTYRECDYGVMRCTHINVSKYNYCFSDFPFPEEVADYPHHSDIAKYIVDYAQYFSLPEIIRFHTMVLNITQKAGEKWVLIIDSVEEDGHTVRREEEIITCRFLIIASGHHAKPTWVRFPGQETFTGEIIHSVNYKDPITNGFVGKRILVVGIGNSAVDVAVDCYTTGRCKSVYISTRSGAWIIPNYIFGFPTDLYVCRAFLSLPWHWGSFILENVIKIISGNPHKWGLNPKMKALQTQPTISPTLIHHIQRKNIKIVPNVTRIEGSVVRFTNGECAQFDKIIYCTGYKIDLPFLSSNIRSKVLNEDSNILNLYKNVFSPDIGQSLAFIGFVQPASGGLLTMSETQARWFAQVCKGSVKLPPKSQMEKVIRTDQEQQRNRWYHSARHTIQKDPITYNDEIAAFFHAKPKLLNNLSLAWRLMFSSCGAAQWRLQGPGKWSGAVETVKSVPMTDAMHYIGIVLLILAGLLLYFVCFVLCGSLCCLF